MWSENRMLHDDDDGGCENKNIYNNVMKENLEI